jgi:hypothetical protein
LSFDSNQQPCLPVETRPMTQCLIPSVAELLSQSRPTALLLISVKMVRVCQRKCLLL